MAANSGKHILTFSVLNGCGVLIDGGIHKASLLAYLAGNPSEVYAAEVPSAQPGLAGRTGWWRCCATPTGWWA